MEYFMKPQLCVVGAGSISSFHIEAALKTGFEAFAICASPNSLRAKDLSKVYNFKHCLSNVNQIHQLNPDAIVIASNTVNLLPIYNSLRHLAIPILIEKPVANSVFEFPKNMNLDDAKTLVGYNRRFYSSIQKLKSQIQDTSEVQSSWTISELPSLPESNKTLRLKALRENAVHYFDLLMYLFGKISGIQIERQFDSNGIRYVSALVRFDLGSVATINVSFNSPSLNEGQVRIDKVLYHLRPIEVLNQFNEIRIEEPTSDSKIRIYRQFGPSCENSLDDDLFKPGFISMYSEFMGLVHGNPIVIGASLRAARNASAFAEILIGDKLSQNVKEITELISEVNLET